MDVFIDVSNLTNVTIPNNVNVDFGTWSEWYTNSCVIVKRSKNKTQYIYRNALTHNIKLCDSMNGK